MQQTIRLKDYPITKVKISDLEFDPLNPNKMSEIEERGLVESFKKWGKLDPIKISEKNSKTKKYKIGDGEHRAAALRNLGEKEIDAYIIPEINDDKKRRLLRQTFNKLRGKHDPGLDVNELNLLLQTHSDDLLRILNINNDTVNELQFLLEQKNNQELELKKFDKPMGFMDTEHSCPKCGYSW